MRASGGEMDEVVMADWLELEWKRAAGLSYFSKKWCVIRGNTLFYWSKSDGAAIGNQAGDVTISSGCEVVKVPGKKKDRIVFDLAVGGESGRRLRFRADSLERGNAWVAALSSLVAKFGGVGDDGRISMPFATTHNQHVSTDLQWNQLGDPTKVFSRSILLGKGAYGSVWEATHSDSGFVMALKIVSLAESATAAELEKEIDVLKKCKHPNIVSYFGSCRNDAADELWILMDNCEVGSVKDIMQTNLCTLEEEQISVVTLNVLKGLSYLHQQSIIHFDIKCANILINKTSEIKLADFGVSEQLEKESGQADDYIGSPLWMSPEVIQKQVYTDKTDIWSLGITVIEMADGCAPHAGTDPMVAMKRIPTLPPPTVERPKNWTAMFNDFVAACLVKTPDDRPSATWMLMNDFIQTTKGTEVLKSLILESLRNKQEERLKRLAADAAGST